MNTPPPLTQSKSSGHGCWKATGIGCLILLIALGGLGYGAYRFAKRQYATLMERLEREGYKRVEGRFINVTETVTEPTIFIGDSIQIQNGSERGIALLCQSGSLRGKMVGNVHFVGRTLTIQPGTWLMKDLDVTAQTVNQFGKIDGKLTGVYQSLNTTAPTNQTFP